MITSNKVPSGQPCASNEQCEAGSACVIVGDEEGECARVVIFGRREPICTQELN